MDKFSPKVNILHLSLYQHYRLTFMPICATLPHMKSILPIIFIVLALTGAITYSLSKRSIPQLPEDSIGIPANELDSEIINNPTPSTSQRISFTDITVTPAVTPTPTPSVVMPDVTEDSETKTTNTTAITTKTTSTTICTPVYGSADTCTEHIVVDTGAENAIFFNLAGISYIAGLAAFIKSKFA